MLLAHPYAPLVIVLLHDNEMYLLRTKNEGWSGKVFIVVEDRTVECFTVSGFFIFVFVFIRRKVAK